jgi:hypothetical protein
LFLIAQAARIVDHDLAARRQADTGRALVEDIEGQQELQPFDLCADGRLCHARQLRCVGEAPHVYDGKQCPEHIGRNIQHACSPRFAPSDAALPRVNRRTIQRRSKPRSFEWGDDDSGKHRAWALLRPVRARDDADALKKAGGWGTNKRGQRGAVTNAVL